jgi:type II secretory pathway pseudopilin PulG
VELLVVIAIIALLMSILMPALARVRKQAKAVLCQSNLKQWGTCFSMYTNENDGYFMPGWCAGLSWPNIHKFYWMEALRPYYGDEGDLRVCPAAVKPGTELGLGEYGVGGGPYSGWGVFSGETGKPSSSWGYVVAGDYGSYGWNGWCGNPPGATPKDLGQEHPVAWNWRGANVRGTSNIPLLLADAWLDGWPRHGDTPPEYNGQPWNSFGNENMGRFCIDRHDGGTLNCVFVDYTVRRVGLKEMWKLKWSRKFDLQGGPTRDEWPDWMRGFK